MSDIAINKPVVAMSGPKGKKPKPLLSPRNIMIYGTLFVAAAYGHDPTDPARAAEMLVVLEVYDTVEEAHRRAHACDPVNGSGKPRSRAAVLDRESGIALMDWTPPATTRSAVPLMTACAA